MKKILLVKTSSLGDVVHNLPVASDIARRFPDARIDWVVEEAFAALPSLHPAVARVIPVAIRRWRKELFGHATWHEIGEFNRLFANERYDAVIDTQGLVKSALVARAAHGERHGFNAKSAREPLAARFYDVTHAVSRAQHAVARNRVLGAAALHYRVDDRIDYGIRCEPDRHKRPYCVLLHATSRSDKLWPELFWMELGRHLSGKGIECVLPWGSEPERERAERLATAIPGATIPSAMSVARAAGLLAGAQAVVGVDTGLTHLAAALGRPVAAIYCGSSPELTGVYGARAARNLGGPDVIPAVDDVMAALAALVPELA